MKHAEKKIVLHAGDYFFGKAGTHVHTLLGSCVSITLWHPKLHIGGMCHFALARPDNITDEQLNPRYAEDCMELFKRSARRKNTWLTEYKAKIFGGGNMGVKQASELLDDDERSPVGGKNTARAFQLLMEEGVELVVAHAGEFGYRRIVFDIATGDVWVRFTPTNETAQNMRSQDGKV